MTKVLTLSPDLQLPKAIGHQAVAIVGIRGSGKTSTAGVLAEELLDHGHPIVILDPTDAWHGLRSSRDGKGQGYPVYVFGGPHGDLDLQEAAGKELAGFVASTQASVILSLRHLRKQAQRRFVTEFGEELFHLKGRPEYRSPLTVFIDEAPLFVPQRVMGEHARTVGAVEDLIARGRNVGFGVVLISQRMATLNKDVATQCDTLICHRLPSPQDRKAIAEWFEENASVEELKATLSSLATLPTGAAWVWSPRLSLYQRTQVRVRRTFDSSSSPDQGPTRPPKVVTPVDLEALRVTLAATVERAKADDPKELRKQLTELRRQLDAAQRLTISSPAGATTTVEVLTDADRAGLSKMLTDLVTLRESFDRVIERAVSDIRQALTAALDDVQGVIGPWREGFAARLEKAGFQRILEKLDRVVVPGSGVGAPPNRPAPLAPRPAQASPKSSPVRHVAATNDDLGKVHRAFLTVLANRQGKGTTRNQLAVFSGYSATSRHVDNTISACRTLGYLDGGREALVITEAGLTALGHYEALPTGPDLLAYWIREAGAAPGAMLEQLARVYPASLSRDQVAEWAGYSVTSRHVDNCLSYLRTLQLIRGDRSALTASEELF